MTKTILHITTSVDGFIADKNGNSDFSLHAQKADETFETFYNSVDAVVMGRRTYDYLKDKTPELFKEKQVYVITHYLKQKEDNITFVHEDIMGCISKLKANLNKNIWIVGGSEIVNILLKEKMIDEIVLTTAPIILGSGTCLFKNDNQQIDVKLKETRSFNDFVQNRYEL